MPLDATLEAAHILLSQTKYDEAIKLKVMARYDDNDIDKIGSYWRCKILRASGQIHLGQGPEEEALAKFKRALAVKAQK